MVQFHPRSISTWSNFTTLAVYLIWCYCFCFQVRILSPSCYLIKNISKNYEKCREEFRMHFDLSHFSPLQAMKMWKHDVLTLLSHFPTLYATKMWQQSHNFHQSKINNISYIYIYTVDIDQHTNERKEIKTTSEMRLILLSFVWQFVVTFSHDNLLLHFLCLVVADAKYHTELFPKLHTSVTHFEDPHQKFYLSPKITCASEYSKGIKW